MKKSTREQSEITSLARRILLATDGSEEAELAAAVAVEVTRSMGSELHVVHVGLLPLTPPYPEVLGWSEDLKWAERVEISEGGLDILLRGSCAGVGRIVHPFAAKGVVNGLATVDRRDFLRSLGGERNRRGKEAEHEFATHASARKEEYFW